MPDNGQTGGRLRAHFRKQAPLLDNEGKMFVLAVGVATVLIMGWIIQFFFHLDTKNCGNFTQFYWVTIPAIIFGLFGVALSAIRGNSSTVINALLGERPARRPPPPTDSPKMSRIQAVMLIVMITGTFGSTMVLMYETGGFQASPITGVILVQVILGQLFTRDNRMKAYVGLVGAVVLTIAFFLGDGPWGNDCTGSGNPPAFLLAISIASVAIGTMVSVLTRTIGEYTSATTEPSSESSEDPDDD